jgi:hypothetical protein
VFGRFKPADTAGEWELVESWTSPDIPVQPQAVISQLNTVAAVARYPEEPCVLLGCGDDPTPRSPAVEAAIVRLDSATIHPIPELSDGLSGNNHPFLHYLAANLPYFTVNAPGDCLNLRAEPSAAAAVVTCVADRVLVRTNGVPVEAEGTRWLPVLLFDGQEGWVAEEFILRQS